MGSTAVSLSPAKLASALLVAKSIDNWVTDIARDLFDVPHLHVTLTIDDLLWPFFHAHRSLLKVLLKCTAQAVRELVEELYPGMRVGMIYTLHPAGRDVGFKPHAHLVMTKGGLKDGQWIEIDRLPGGRLAAECATCSASTSVRLVPSIGS